MEDATTFDRATLERAFERLGELAAAAGKVIELSIYGGSAMILTLNHRPATRDVDAVFERDRTFVRSAAGLIAEEFGWPAEWLNDSVKGFLSRADGDAKSLFRTFPGHGPIGLRVLVASPDYLFAMKCLAMRIGEADREGDLADIRRLGRTIGIRSAEDAIAIVTSYYPADTLPPKTRFGLEEIFGTE